MFFYWILYYICNCINQAAISVQSGFLLRFEIARTIVAIAGPEKVAEPPSWHAVPSQGMCGRGATPLGVMGVRVRVFVGSLSCSHLSGFIARLVRALHRHRRGHGLQSR